MPRRSSYPLLSAAVCLVGLILTGAVALLTPTGQIHDSVTLFAFQSLNRPAVASVATFFIHLGDPAVYALLGVAFVGVALTRGRPRLALAVPVTMFAAAGTSELLKPVLATPKLGNVLDSTAAFGAGSWPSGHATAAMTAGLCAVLVAPRRLRPLVALLATLLAVGVGYSLLVLGWHLPSDVFGGYLVAGLFVSVSVTVLWWADRRWPARTGRRAIARAADGSLVPAAALAISLVAIAGVLVMRRDSVATYAAAHPSFFIGAFAIAGLAAILATALTLALRAADR